MIVTVHNETYVTGPTMRAAEAAIERAIADGFSVEKIIALDAATPAAKAHFAQEIFDDWRKIELTEGDLGRARNAVVKMAKGAAIAFLDADDLFSENWLSLGLARLHAGEKLIVHPELNWVFDGSHSVFVNPDQDDPLFTPYHFYFMNYYDSLCITPREAHLAIPYSERDIPAGLSFQDWQFSIETMAAGWKHVAAPDTIIFKRRRDESLVTQSRDRRAVVRMQEAMSIENVRSLSGPTKPRVVPPLPPKEGIPYSGLHLQQRAERAKNSRRLRRPSFAYGKIKPHLDGAFYFASYEDLMAYEKLDPVTHYVRAGASEGRDPTPTFSTQAYLNRYPDVAKSRQNPFHHWVTKGKAEGRIGAPYDALERMGRLMGLPVAEVQDLWTSRIEELRIRFEYGELGRMVKVASAIEPMIERGWPEALRVKLPPLNGNMVTMRTAALAELHQQLDYRPARAVIVVNRPRWGKAPRLEGHLARALADKLGAENVIVVATDTSGKMPKGKMPDGVRYADLARVANGLEDDPRSRLLVEFLRSVRPEYVFNINSRLMWDSYGPYGIALAASMKLYGCLLCNEQTAYGHWTGYALNRFYRSINTLTAVCTDSHYLADEIIERHQVPENERRKVQVLSGPVNADIAAASQPETGETRRPQVFWAGRFDPQKRVDIVYAVAAAMPHVDFRMWGEPVMKHGASLPEKPANVIHEGVYNRFTDLPMNEADLWLYTSGWDGVPQMLLEVAMTAVPIVGSLVGGTGEVLIEGMAQGVTDANDPSAYVARIDTVLSNRKDARVQAGKLRDLLIEQRTAENFAAQLANVLDL